MKKLLFGLLLASTTLNASHQELQKNYGVKHLLASLSEQQKTELVEKIQQVLDNETNEQTALLPSGQEIALTIVAVVIGGLMVLLLPGAALVNTLCEQNWLLTQGDSLCELAKALTPGK